MKTSKLEYFKILDSLENVESCGFHYTDTCNDPYSHCSFQPKRAKYEFLLVVPKSKDILLESLSFQKNTHEEKKSELVKRFQHWGKLWKSKKDKK